MSRLLLFIFFILLTSDAFAQRTIEQNETWSGKVVLSEAVRVAESALLTITPGTEVLFDGSVGLTVHGRMLAKGTAQQPIRFLPGPGEGSGSWQGISFLMAKGESELAHLSIDGAVQALTINGSRVSISSSSIENGVRGIYMGAEAFVTIDDVAVRNMSETAIEASTHSQGRISNCRIDSIGGAAVLAGKQTRFLVRGNQISKTKVAVITSGDSSSIEENVITETEVGIVITQASRAAVIRGNRITGAKKGISCQQFASPTIVGNTVEGCDEGLDFFQASSPVVKQNRLTGNRRALSAIQMCNPEVMHNDFVDNDEAVYLHLSSYAVLRDNNFENNRLHIALDNMSYDWELRANRKPSRNRQMQNDFLVKQGRAMPQSMAVEVKSEGYVNARGNYWGEETTLEMDSKGNNAGISTIMDGYDLETLSYDGWPGEYKKDRVSYDDWKSERITGTGP